jgi:hypothetical protein
VLRELCDNKKVIRALDLLRAVGLVRLIVLVSLIGNCFQAFNNAIILK